LTKPKEVIRVGKSKSSNKQSWCNATQPSIPNVDWATHNSQPVWLFYAKIKSLKRIESVSAASADPTGVNGDQGQDEQVQQHEDRYSSSRFGHSTQISSRNQCQQVQASIKIVQRYVGKALATKQTRDVGRIMAIQALSLHPKPTTLCLPLQISDCLNAIACVSMGRCYGQECGYHISPYRYWHIRSAFLLWVAENQNKKGPFPSWQNLQKKWRESATLQQGNASELLQRLWRHHRKIMTDWKYLLLLMVVNFDQQILDVWSQRVMVLVAFRYSNCDEQSLDVSLTWMLS
jgi:hypothetical protein